MPALKVRFVSIKLIPLNVVRVTVLLPRVIVLTPLTVDKSDPAVTAKFAVSNVPCVTVMALVEIFNASPSVTVMPELLTVTVLNVLPAVVSVPVPLNVTVPVWV